MSEDNERISRTVTGQVCGGEMALRSLQSQHDQIQSRPLFWRRHARDKDEAKTCRDTVVGLARLTSIRSARLD